MDKHEFAEIICEGLKKRKIDKAKKDEGNFYAYVSGRTKQTEKVHNRFRR